MGSHNYQQKTEQPKQEKNDNKREFGFWRALVYSFYSKKLYQDVAQHWRGIGALYLLALGAIFLIIQLLLPVPVSSPDQMMTQVSNQVTEQVDTNLSTDKHEVMNNNVVKVTSTNNTSTIVIHHNGKDGERNVKIEQRQGHHVPDQVETQNSNTIEVSNISSSAIQSSLPKLFLIMIMKMLTIIATVFSYYAVLIIYLVVSLLLKIFIRKLSFCAVYRLLVVATTPTAFIALIFWYVAQSILTVSNAENVLQFEHYSLVIFIIHVCYIIFAIRANYMTKTQKIGL